MKNGHESPVNSTAARVMARGTEYVSGVSNGAATYQEMPIATRPIGRAAKQNPHFVDCTGVKFGRFTVIGLAAEHPQRWVVKCACGFYSLRSTKAVRNPKNTTDCCKECQHLLYLKRTEIFRRTGRNVEWANLP